MKIATVGYQKRTTVICCGITTMPLEHQTIQQVCCREFFGIRIITNFEVVFKQNTFVYLQQ